MADKSISELVAATQINPTDMFVMEQSGTAKKASGQLFETWLLSFAEGHGGIQSIEKTGTSGLTDTYRITYSDASTTTYTVTNGNGIANITWTTSGTSGNGQYHNGTITYTDGTTSTIQIRDGIKGNAGTGAYLWIRYAAVQPTSNADMGITPDKWIGIYSGTSSTAPTSYSSYQWYEWKGDTGLTGDPAYISFTSTSYQASASGTTVPTGNWSSSVPSVNPGQYLWTRNIVTFNEGSPITWYAVAYQGLNGSGAVSKVNGLSPNSSGEVNVTATDIQATGGDVQTVLNSKQDAITGKNGILKESGGNISAAAKGTDYGAKSFTVTLTAAGWSSNAQSITNSNFATSGYAYIVSPRSSSSDTTSRSAYISGGVYADDVTTASQMTFHCKTAPTSDITVNIVRVVSA